MRILRIAAVIIVVLVLAAIGFLWLSAPAVIAGIEPLPASAQRGPRGSPMSK